MSFFTIKNKRGYLSVDSPFFYYPTYLENYSFGGIFGEKSFKNTFLNGHKITTVFTRKKGWSLKDSSFGNGFFLYNVFAN